MSDSLRPHELQHTRLPCFPLSPSVCSNSCPFSQWCYLTLSSSTTSFSFCLQSFLASWSFPMNQLFTSGDQNTGASISASILPTNSHSLFLLGLAGLISLHSKRLSRVPCNATTWKLQVLYFAYIDGWTFKIIKFLLKVCWYLKAVLS